MLDVVCQPQIYALASSSADTKHVNAQHDKNMTLIPKYSHDHVGTS